MKVITVTEKNIKDVYARMKKFFYNKNYTGFTSCHNFDCGFKKRISKYIEIDGEKISVERQYLAPLKMFLENDTIYINLNVIDGCHLTCGDKIAFLGNRIMFRNTWRLMGSNYVYHVFQATPVDITDIQRILYRDTTEQLMEALTYELLDQE